MDAKALQVGTLVANAPMETGLIVLFRPDVKAREVARILVKLNAEPVVRQLGISHRPGVQDA